MDNLTFPLKWCTQMHTQIHPLSRARECCTLLMCSSQIRSEEPIQWWGSVRESWRTIEIGYIWSKFGIFLFELFDFFQYFLIIYVFRNPEEVSISSLCGRVWSSLFPLSFFLSIKQEVFILFHFLWISRPLSLILSHFSIISALIFLWLAHVQSSPDWGSEIRGAERFVSFTMIILKIYSIYFFFKY